MALPYFQGRSTPDWNSEATAEFSGITLGTTREDMLKALLEGIGMEIANNIASFEKYVPLQKILINGGLSKCEAFERIREGARAKEYTVNKEKHEVYEKLRAKMTERYRRENV